MKAYDKIALALAIVLLAGAIFWAGKIRNAAEVRDPGPIATLGEPIQLDPVPELNTGSVVWEEAGPQDEEGLWLYRVFTPPIMYKVLQNGVYVISVVRPDIPEVVGPVEKELPPFGVRFAEIRSETFRFRLETVFEGDEPGNKSELILIFGDRESSLTQSPTFRMQGGETNNERGLRVDDVRLEVEVDAGGGTTRAYYADVTDLNTGRRVSLRNNETIFLQQPTAILVSTLGTGEIARVTAEGDTFTMNAGTESAGDYTVKAISLERGLIRLVKNADYLDEPQEETLRVGIPPEETAPVASPAIEPEPEPVEPPTEFPFN